MMWRRMMLSRKTDPKTGKHTSCQPAQSKARGHFTRATLWKFTGKCRRVGYHLDPTPGLNPYRKNPSVATLFGEHYPGKRPQTAWG